jgi:hypothetical protein
MGDNRPVRYTEQRDGEEVIIYRASGLGLCDRIYVALEQSYEPMAFPAWFQAVLDEGTAMEDTIRKMFEEEMEETVQGDQQEVELEVMPGVFIRGHIDGKVMGGKDPAMDALWEGKKVRPSGWDAFKRKGVEWHKNYPMQVSVYMHALGLQRLFFTGGLYDPDKEEILETYTHAYPDPPINLLGIRKRIAKLEGIINGDKDAMDVACPKTPDYPCPFFYLHDDDAPEPKVRPADDDIAPLLTHITDLEDSKRPLAAEVRALDKKIKECKEGITGWYEAAGLDVGDESKVQVGDDTYVLKVQDVARKGYTVEAGGYTKVNVKKNPDKKGK